MSSGDLELDAVDCDQRFRLPMPSLKPPTRPSAAMRATLERRLEGGGVEVLSALWGLDGSGIVSLKEAERLTVTTEDEETELDREDWRRWAGPDRSIEGCWEAAMGLYMFIATMRGVGGRA